MTQQALVVNGKVVAVDTFTVTADALVGLDIVVPFSSVPSYVLLTTFPDYVAPGWAYDGANFTAPAAPTPTPPDAITMRQCRLALHNAGLLDSVATVISGLLTTMQATAQIEWDYSSTVLRDSPLVAAIATGLTLSSMQLDQLFITAATL